MGERDATVVRVVNRKVADDETMALGEDFGDTPTMTDMPISLIA
jgi:hypothetical protein